MCLSSGALQKIGFFRNPRLVISTDNLKPRFLTGLPYHGNMSSQLTICASVTKSLHKIFRDFLCGRRGATGLTKRLSLRPVCLDVDPEMHPDTHAGWKAHDMDAYDTMTASLRGHGASFTTTVPPTPTQPS